jgi:DNA-binding transcriptional MerR regulator
MDNLAKIRDVALKYDVSARTLRYYEDMALIQSKRSDDYAYRLYDEKAVERLEQILILRKLNISVKDILKIFESGSSEVLLNALGKKVMDIDSEVALLYELKSIVLEFIDILRKSDFQNSGDIRLLYDKAKEIEQQISDTSYQGNPASVNRLFDISERLEKLPDIRIIELPKCKMISSGISAETDLFADNGLLMRFCEWWLNFDKQRKDRFFPRDFMWYDPETKGTAWWYAPEEVPSETGGYEVIDFEGGLYAAAVSKDGDDNDGWRVYSGILKWIDASGHFVPDERPGHYHMSHVITSQIVDKVMGYGQLEIYVPIKLRAK